jgi:alkylation response protein AidB-like acyl-CoA dehydrogenase
MYRLTNEQQEIVDRARGVAESDIARHAAAVDAEARFPREAMAALGRAGLLGLNVPAGSGGLGHGFRTVAAVVDTLAQACPSTAMVTMMHYSGVAAMLAAPGVAAGWLREAAAGRHLSTLAFSEKGSRSQFWAPVSRAARANGNVELNAEKSWVTSAGIADSMIVSTLAHPGEDGAEVAGNSVYVVLKDDPGVAISGGWNSLGMRGNQSNPVTLREVRVPAAERALCANGAGLDLMLGSALPTFQLCQGAIGVGIAEAAVQATARHLGASRLEHTGNSLADLPNLRARLAEMRIETDRARAYLVSVIDRLESGAADAVLHVLAAKASSGETAVTVTDLAMRACGGAAFSRHLGVERFFRDARAAVVMAPTTDHIREFVGRAVLGMPLFG